MSQSVATSGRSAPEAAAESSLETTRWRIERERQALTTVLHCLGTEVRALRRRVEELERQRDSAVQQAQALEEEARRLFRTWDTERQVLEAQWHKRRQTQIAVLEQQVEAIRQQSAEERRVLNEQIAGLCQEAAQLTRQRDAALQQVQAEQEELLQFCRTWDAERHALRTRKADAAGPFPESGLPPAQAPAASSAAANWAFLFLLAAGLGALALLTIWTLGSAR